ncbi:MAG: OmpA family protein [Myxococcales bacterium]|nr:OmpA family protein [Myxococcales bacterium]
MAAAAVIALAGSPAQAVAQSEGNLYINFFRPAIDSRGYITVNASSVLGKGEFSFGLQAIDWGHALLALKNGNATYDVTDTFSGTFGGAYGLKFGPVELELGLSVPLLLVNGDRGPDDEGDPNTPNDDQAFEFAEQGLGNVGVHLKTRFIKTSKPPHVGVGLILSAYLDTASDNIFGGDNQLMPEATLILDKEFGSEGRFRAALTGGFRYRGKVASFTDVGVGGATGTNQTVAVGSEVPYGLGLSYDLSLRKVSLVAEVIGSYGMDAENYKPLEALLALKLYLARNSFFSFGGGRGLRPSDGASPDWRLFVGIVFEPNLGDRDGDGIKDDVDQCPLEKEDFDGFEDADGCPDPDNDKDGILDIDDACPNDPEDFDGNEDTDGCPEGEPGDRDGDGIMDVDDQCPDDPEDKDGFEDADGCPDPDNDKDGILDRDDLCPNDPEDFDKFEDEDGCPDPDNDKDRILDNDDRCPNEPEDYDTIEDEDGCPEPGGRVVVTDSKIEILDKVYFDLDKATIKPVSYPILDAVAGTLLSNPDIELIEIQGHTDQQGGEDYNLKLSDDRAHSVEAYLISKGVEPVRLQAQGYGESQLIDERNNQTAYEKNRRVEFLILKRAN